MKFNFLCISLCLVISGCGGTLAPTHPHEGPVAAPVVINPTAIETENDLKIKSELRTAANQQDTHAILASADGLFFNLPLWQNEKVIQSDDFKKFIHAVMSAVIAVEGSKPTALTDLKFWLRFATLIDQQCDEDLKNCTIVNLLKTSPQSAEAVRQLANKQTDIEKKYKYLFISLDLQNNSFPAETVDLFLAQAKQYRNKVIDDIEVLKKASHAVEFEKKQAVLAKINGTLSLIISLVQEGKLKTANTDWIRDLNLTASFREGDIQLAAEYTLYEKGTKTLTPEFKKEIISFQAQAGSISQKRQTIETTNPRSLTEFSMKPVVLDEYFYVVDQVYTSRWSIRQADVFVKTAGLSVTTLAKVAQNYLLTDVVYTMTIAQNELKLFVQEYTSVSPENIFIAARKTLSRSAVEARALPAKAQKLSQLISLIAGNNSIEASQFSAQANSIQKTIKIAITYPYTLILLYLAQRMGASADTQISVINFSGQGKPKMKQFVKFLFLGNWPPTLDFTDDLVPLTSFEIIEAIEISAKNHLYENLGLSLDEILVTLYELLSQAKLQRLADDQSNLEEKYTSSEWISLQQLSHSYKLNNPLKRTIGFAELYYSPTLGNASLRLKETFGGFSGRIVDNVYLKEYGYFTVSNRMSDQLEWIRSDFFNSIIYFDSIQKIVLESSGQALPKLKARVEATKEKVKLFLETLVQRDKEFDQSYFTLVNQERKMIVQIINYEKAYWKLAHQQIKNLRAKTASTPLSALALGITLPEGIEFRTQISADGAMSYGVDFFIRVKAYLQHGLPAAGLPPIQPQLNVAWTPGLDLQPIYQNSKTQLIPYSDDAEEFSTAGLRASNIAGRDPQAYWFTLSYMNVYSFRDYYDAKSTMYRMSPLAKKILGLDTLVTLDQLLQVPLKVIPYVSIINEEKAAMRLLGISTRYSLDSLRDYNLYYDATNENAAPLYDYILNQLQLKWMGTFGHADQWEDVKAGNARGRPEELLPIPVLADRLNKYINDRKDNFLIANLKTPAVIVGEYKETVRKDLQLLAQARDAIAIKATQPLPVKTVSYTTQENMPLSYVSSAAIEDVQRFINSFHQKTDGKFK
ncbi:MAG: hypothetical protein H7061_06165 [Bdellovibrionaceae bacterium]|nr:hypothetical protein [Bdellovibrio sp.]